MSITIKKKEDKPYVDCTHVRVWGETRENLKRIAEYTGRGVQDVGHDLLQQAINEVMGQIPFDHKPRGQHGQVRIRRRK
jgi:hypothetical protein